MLRNKVCVEQVYTLVLYNVTTPPGVDTVGGLQLIPSPTPHRFQSWRSGARDAVGDRILCDLALRVPFCLCPEHLVRCRLAGEDGRRYLENIARVKTYWPRMSATHGRPHPTAPGFIDFFPPDPSPLQVCTPLIGRCTIYVWGMEMLPWHIQEAPRPRSTSWGPPQSDYFCMSADTMDCWNALEQQRS